MIVLYTHVLSSISTITLVVQYVSFFFFFSSRRRHTRLVSDWSSDVCSSDLARPLRERRGDRPGEARLRRRAADLSAHLRRTGVAPPVSRAARVLRVARLPQAPRHTEASARPLRPPPGALFRLPDARRLDLLS